MRIAVVAVPAKKGTADPRVEALAKGLEKMGHRVDLLNAWTDDGVRLGGYEYIVLAAEQVSLFGGKMPEVLPRMLSAASSLVGKKSAAFLVKKYPFTGKALKNLMRAMEKEGMFVNWFDILISTGQAEAMGKHFGA